MICPNCGHLQAPEVEREIRQRERKLLADLLMAHMEQGDIGALSRALKAFLAATDTNGDRLLEGSPAMLGRFVDQLVDLCLEVKATTRQEALAERRRKRMMRG